MRSKRLTLFFMLWTLNLNASYRVYQLMVETWDQGNNSVIKYRNVILSNLDHVQYQDWYGGNSRMNVSYIDSWYCPGDTSRKKYCDKPNEKEDLRNPASDRPKRLPLDRQPVIP